MSGVTSNIFEDLGIDTTGFLESASNFKRLEDQVFLEAKKLESILDGGSSVTQVEDRAEKEYLKNPEYKNQLNELFNEPLILMYESCEHLPLPVVYGLMKELETLTKKISDTLFTRAAHEAIDLEEPLHNKKLVQLQHKRLREVWATITNAGKLLFSEDERKSAGITFKQLKSKSGNYSASITDTLVYYFPNDSEPLYNPIAVAKRLGIYYEGIKFMDILEYCDEHPDQVMMKRVKL